MQNDQTLLRTTLALRDHQQVKIVNATGRVIRRVSAITALFLACSSDYEWQGGAKRVKAMRSLRPEMPYLPCWRNQEAAVLPPSPEWFAGMRSTS